MFFYESKLTYPVHISDQNLKNSIDLLIISNRIKSCYVYIKYFNKCMLKSGFNEFKNYSRQIATPLKIYADFECILKSVKSNKGFCKEKYEDHIPWSFCYKFTRVDNKFSKPIVVYRVGNSAYRFIEAILKEYEYCKKVMKKHFNKNLIMTEKEEENFRTNNTCWICKKLVENEKVRAAHCSCNVNLKRTEKVSIIFHSLKGYDSHLIIKQIGKFNAKVDIIPSRLEKYMVFTINKNLVFIDSKHLWILA